MKMNTLSNDKLIDWGFEATKMSQTPSYIQRSAGNWYEHSQVYEGYTQNNQIMGVGAGHGNDLQTLSIDLKDGFDKIGLKFQHISHNPYLEVGENAVKVRNTKWDDFVFGTTWGRRFNNLIVNANVEWVNARNYNYINGTHKGNVFIFLNAMYLW